MPTVSLPPPPPVGTTKPSQDAETAAALARPAARDRNVPAGASKVTPVEAVEVAATASRRLQQANLTIDFDKQANRYVYKLVDPNTKEVLREIPSSDVLRMLRTYRDPTGVKVDQQT